MSNSFESKKLRPIPIVQPNETGGAEQPSSEILEKILCHPELKDVSPYSINSKVGKLIMDTKPKRYSPLHVLASYLINGFPGACAEHLMEVASQAKNSSSFYVEKPEDKIILENLVNRYFEKYPARTMGFSQSNIQTSQASVEIRPTISQEPAYDFRRREDLERFIEHNEYLFSHPSTSILQMTIRILKEVFKQDFLKGKFYEVDKDGDILFKMSISSSYNTNHEIIRLSDGSSELLFKNGELYIRAYYAIGVKAGIHVRTETVYTKEPTWIKIEESVYVNDIFKSKKECLKTIVNQCLLE